MNLLLSFNSITQQEVLYKNKNLLHDSSSVGAPLQFDMDLMFLQYKI